MTDRETIRKAEELGWLFVCPSGDPKWDHWLSPKGEKIYNFPQLKKIVNESVKPKTTVGTPNRKRVQGH